MTGGPQVPTPADVWDFLLGLKEATESGFQRLGSEMGDGFTRVRSDTTRLLGDVTRLQGDLTSLQADVTHVQSDLQRIERRLARGDDRSSEIGTSIEGVEHRVMRLEQHFL